MTESSWTKEWQSKLCSFLPDYIFNKILGSLRMFNSTFPLRVFKCKLACLTIESLNLNRCLYLFLVSIQCSHCIYVCVLPAGMEFLIVRQRHLSDALKLQTAINTMKNNSFNLNNVIRVTFHSRTSEVFSFVDCLFDCSR